MTANMEYCPRCLEADIQIVMHTVHISSTSRYYVCLLCGFRTKPIAG